MRQRLLVVGFFAIALTVSVRCSAADAPPTGPDAGSSSAIDILKGMLEVNSVWLDPKPANLSYVVTANGPNTRYVNRVWIQGDKARWEMSKNMSEGDRGIGPYALVIRDGKECYVDGPATLVQKGAVPAQDFRNLKQGTTWTTAIHALYQGGVPQTSRLVEKITADNQERAIVEVDLGEAVMDVGLGLRHVHLGQTGKRAKRVRFHVNLPQHTPAREEFLDGKADVLYGSEWLEFGKHLAPVSVTHIRNGILNTKVWELEARFMKFEDVWVLDRAFNRHDGKLVTELAVSDLSAKPADESLFVLPLAEGSR